MHAPPIVVSSLNLEAVKRQLCLAALQQERTLGAAAGLLGISRGALRRLMTKFGLEIPKSQAR